MIDREQVQNEEGAAGAALFLFVGFDAGEGNLYTRARL